MMVPDFYAMLGVDPLADRSTVESALERARHLWSSGTRNPKHKHTYQAYLDAIPEIRRRLLGDPEARSAYDAELVAGTYAARSDNRRELARRVRLRGAKGGLTVTDRRLLLELAAHLGLSSEDLAPIIETYPLRPDSGRRTRLQPRKTATDSLDPALCRQIRSALASIGKRDLYHAIDLGRDAESTEIFARADEARRKWIQKSIINAEKTAWLDVISFIQSHLLTTDARAKYDRSLTHEVEAEFRELAAFALDGSAYLDRETHELLMIEATALGIEAADADGWLKEVCLDSGIETAEDVPTEFAGEKAGSFEGSDGDRDVPDPSDLRVVRVDRSGKFQLRWQWPDQVAEASIVARSGTPPIGPGDPGAVEYLVDRAEYDRQGAATLRLPAEPSTPEPWHIAVFCQVSINGVRIVSQGNDASARTSVLHPHPEATVTYTVRRLRIPGNAWELTLQTDPPGSSVPATVLVAHPRAVPISVEDGRVIARIPNSGDGDRFRIRPGINLRSHGMRLFIDPTVEPTTLPPIRFKHPESAGTRI